MGFGVLMDEFDRFLGAGENENDGNNEQDNGGDEDVKIDRDVISAILLAVQTALEKILENQNQVVITLTRQTNRGPNVWSTAFSGATIMVDSLEELVNTVDRST
jgi:hypothetical protein